MACEHNSTDGLLPNATFYATRFECSCWIGSSTSEYRFIQCSGGIKMLAIIGVVLLVLWLAGFLAFHVAGGLIHLLVVGAVILFVLHFFRGRRATV